MSIFKLQQFSIDQSQCAMKVCTDSLIFGAMAPIKKGAQIIDIGTGTGLLSLMAMQLGARSVLAVELVAEAARQAQQNIDACPWPHDISIVNQDIAQLSCSQRFDVVMSNPPFFANHLKTASAQRKTARHTDSLSYAQLIASAKALVADDGVVYLLLPLHAQQDVVAIALAAKLYLVKQVNYITVTGGKAKVCALTFSLEVPVRPINPIELTIYTAHQQYSQASTKLLADFLLRFSPDIA